MWFFTELADQFDRRVHEDEVFLDQWGTEAATKHLQGSGWGTAELVIAGALGAVHKFSTPVTKTFVDVLRIGDGVKKGGWGYGQDALRALMVVGPALRGLRWASGLVASVDANTSMGNCAWVAAARSARLTGRLFASIKDVAKFAGMELAETGGVDHFSELMSPLKMLGVDASLVVPKNKAAFSTMKEVAEMAAQRRDGVLMFGIQWNRNGVMVGHALIARWGPAGVRIVDRTGAAVRTLAELEAKFPGYQGLSNAVPYGEGLFIPNAITTKLLSTVPSLLNILAVEVKPALITPAIPLPVQRSGTAPRAVPPPAATKKNMGRLTIHTTCTYPNSDTAQVCTSYYTYNVVAGDTLSLIAKYAYKDANRWKIIYEANRTQLGVNPHNPNALKVGMELLIPSK